MSRPWTRSMPIPSEENYDAQPSNEFTQGQSSQPGNESALHKCAAFMNRVSNNIVK